MITIVSKDYCPYCSMAKDLISNLGFEYEEIDVSNDYDKLREIVNLTQMMTVPQIFAGEIKKENLLGGYDDIAKLHKEGKLIKRLKIAY